VPGWAQGKALVAVNGATVVPVLRNGYAVVERMWKAGDRVSLILPLDLRLEPVPGRPILSRCCAGRW
jgi:DUF1680 family protein